MTNDKIYAGGGYNGTSYLDSIEVYDPNTKQWANAGNFPENKLSADAVVLNDKVYVIAGATSSGVYSNKVFAADLNASVAGVYDLYRKDGNASAGTPLVQAEVADGSVTTAKLAPEVAAKLDQNATIGSGSITKSMLANEVLNDLNKSLEDNSVTMAKLEPQLRADLNKTTSRPFGASLSNPYGILGLPVTGTTYTVPSGKVLVITSSGTTMKINYQDFRSSNSPPSFIPAGTNVTITSGNRWTGYLSNNLEGITAITGTTYTVPSGKVLVITSSGTTMKINYQDFRSSNSPPSFIPAGTNVTITSGNRWTGYLIDQPNSELTTFSNEPPHPPIPLRRLPIAGNV